MKNISSLKWILFLAVLVFGLNAKAELPPLTVSYPPCDNLTQKYSNSHDFGYIDVNKDGRPDFEVFFTYSSDLSHTSYCYIQSYNSSGNSVAVEYVYTMGTSPVANAPLSDVMGGTPFTAFFDYGNPISDAFPHWETFSYISYREGTGGEMEEAPLASNFTTPDNDGYIGVYFQDITGSNWYYGWLNVEIAPDQSFVMIISAGSSQIADDPIPAGFTPFAVPIPIIASILGFGLIGGGLYLRRRKKNN